MFVYSMVLLLTCYVQIKAEKCATPKSLEGNCTVAASNCEELTNLLNRNYLDEEAAKFVKQSQCGFEDLASKFCCPISNITVNFQPPPDLPKRELTLPKLVLRFYSEELLPADDECGEQVTDGDRIYGGVITELGEFPWSALLKYRTPYGDGYGCGGTLISDRYVITAGHCVKGRQVEQVGKLISVTLGEYNLKKEIDCDLNWETYCAPPAVDVPVESYFAHPDYTPGSLNRYHDIALIRFSKNVAYSDFIQPICLPKDENDGNAPKIARKKILYVAGWGETETSPSSDVKLKARVPEINAEECALTYKQKGVNVSDHQICAGGETNDSCRGDSGGPLMYQNVIDPIIPRWHLIGVVSFGYKHCATQGVPAIYTKISSYLDWIKTNIKP